MEAADFSAPTFSLGLDLEQDEKEAEEETLDRNDDLEEPQLPALKRLRRGRPSPISSSSVDDDDVIEDFSSQGDEIRQDPDIFPSPQSHLTSISSKASLRFCGILSSQPTSKLKTTNITPGYKNASISASFKASSSKDSFPRLTDSPLRKFKLLESDPSFSLGLDADFEEEYDDLGLGKALNHDVLEEPQQRRVLKRLRRGLPLPIPSTLRKDGNVKLGVEIKDLSSQEGEYNWYPDISPSVQSHATCCSSNVPLPCQGSLSSQSASELKTPRITTAYNASIPASFEASSNKGQFPKFTVSPLRKILILDSDSDEPTSEGKINNTDVYPSSKNREAASFQSATKKAEKTFRSHKHQVECFWKNFSPKENVNAATPALDDFCDEYFKSSEDQLLSHCWETAPSFCSSKVLDPADCVNDFEGLFQQKSSSSGETDRNWDFSHPKPPAYPYFYHDDARIRTLVRKRLPHFSPIGSGDRSGNQQFIGDELDYIGQFYHGDGPTQGCTTNRKGIIGRNSRVKQKRPNTTNSKGTIENRGNWVNPRNITTIPKDAGRRRVSAVGSQSCGHWFTGKDGRKVYVSTNGQELTGQLAYRQYRNESGGGFRKGKKKAATCSKGK